MSKVKVADFYYGSVISMLLNNKVVPVLIEENDDRQVYDLTTNTGNFRLFVKYRANKQEVKTKDYKSWFFAFSQADIAEISKYILDEYNLIMALVCGVEGLNDSEVALLNTEQIKNIIVDHKKTSISISRKKNERAYRISIGGGREKSIQVKANQFEELFKV